MAIICLGSLINFHQYKIWGKPLIPNFIGYKRDVEKYSKTLSLSKYSSDNKQFHHDYQGNDCDFPIETLLAHFGPVSIIAFDLSQNSPVSNRVSSCGLRGPPIS